LWNLISVRSDTMSRASTFSSFVRRIALAFAGFGFLTACAGTDSTDLKTSHVAFITLSTPTHDIKATHTVALKAEALDAAGNPVPNISFGWTSEDNEVATVDFDGIVRGVSAGSAAITASANGKIATLNITVSRAPLATITLEIPDGELVAGRNIQMKTVVIDSSDKAVTNPELLWQSNAPTVGRIGASGLLTTFAAGTLRIDASAEGIVGSIQVTIFSQPPVRFKMISAHDYHTCGLSTQGSTFCWGGDYDGTLGAGSPPPTMTICHPSEKPCSSILFLVDGEHAFSSLAQGSPFHTCALAAEGAYCWGHGAEGEIGNGSNSAINPVPTKVESSATYASLSTGGHFTCGLTTFHAIDCWGLNLNGELGDSTVTELCSGSVLFGDSISCSTKPRRVSSSVPFTKLSVGDFNACGLSEDGAIYCWGLNRSGELGAVATSMCDGEPCNRIPAPVVTDLRFTDISVGAFFTCGISTNERTYCWGENNDGQLGSGTFSPREPHPVPINSTLSFVKVFAGQSTACALDAEGAAYCWGYNNEGEIGDGSTSKRATPVPIGQGLRFTSLSLGSFHGCGIATDGYAYCWGYNSTKQLGIGRDGSALTPTRVMNQ
jgi:alpha-tubulin suppressor-like RCC1 family protein